MPMKQSAKIIITLLEGVGSILSLFPQKNKRKITLPSSSTNDWEKIGSDMGQVFNTIESQMPEEKNS